MTALLRPIEAPNYTQIPNVVFDEWMKTLSDEGFKTLIAVCYFCINNRNNYVSIEKISDLTGFDSGNCEVYLVELRDYCLIEFNENDEVRMVVA